MFLCVSVRQDYIVYSLPPACHRLVRDVGEFGLQERQDFIDCYLTVRLTLEGW